MKLLLMFCALVACGVAKPARPSPWDAFFALPSDSESSSSEVSSESTADSASDDNSEPSIFSFMPMSIFRFPIFSPDIFRLPKIPSPDSDPDTKVTNSTSETKVVNGHKIQINTTEYKNLKTGSVGKTVLFTSHIVSEEKPKPSITENATEKDDAATSKGSDENLIGAEEIAEPDPMDNLEA